jgi:dTDP-4-amino-4,6-dideoxygalactose transaminase/predicted O-methyltransferase YrrM
VILSLFKHLSRHLTNWAKNGEQTRAVSLAEKDARIAAECFNRYFSLSSRPVIRWIKGDGLDDAVTRAAIGQATRLFGSEVDYCLCTNGIDATRARMILEWADQPVEWWPVSNQDNPQLAQLLLQAGCPPDCYGYWWKWFPERVRPNAPEWILDGDMVITGKPAWFENWLRGTDQLRVTQDDRWPAEEMYGKYTAHVDLELKLYSGLISLPPGVRYMEQILEVLAIQPLMSGHDGRRDMCEQGVIAAIFQKLGAKPIPLYEFPFGRAFEDHIDYGLQGDQGLVWGYHFGNSFRLANPHFERLTAEHVIFSKPDTGLLDRFHWMGGTDQWGVPGWTISDGCAQVILERAKAFAGRSVLEIGTSRGRLTAMLATLGCQVTTVDHQNRGAAQNLKGLSVLVIQDDAVSFLSRTMEKFDLIVVDFHGNSEAEWRRYAKPLLNRLNRTGTLLLNNATLYEIQEWRDETGVRWFLDQLTPFWKVELYTHTLPGVAIVTNIISNIPFCDLSRAHTPIRGEIDRAIADCMDRSSFLRGSQTRAFEEEWADYCGQAYAVCCNSGTDALTLAATAMNLKTATIPANTLPLTGIGLHRGDTQVRVAEIRQDGWMAAPGSDAVPVLIFGRIPRPDEGSAQLYDAAHAHGWKPPTGSVAAWSFYPTKTLGALGDAGAVTTDNATLAEEMRKLCGRDDQFHDRRQITSRIDEIQAAVLRVKLRYLDKWLAERREIGAHYDKRLGALGITLRSHSLHHLYVIRIAGRDQLAHFLKHHGINTKVHWSISLHRVSGPWVSEGDYPHADEWCASVLSLPCFPGLRLDEIDRVCNAIEDWYEHGRRLV